MAGGGVGAVMGQSPACRASGQGLGGRRFPDPPVAGMGGVCVVYGHVFTCTYLCLHVRAARWEELRGGLGLGHLPPAYSAHCLQGWGVLGTGGGGSELFPKSWGWPPHHCESGKASKFPEPKPPLHPSLCPRLSPPLA